MLGEALSLLEQAEKLQRHFFRVGALAPGNHTWEPPVDMVETAYDLRILMALPGVDPEAVAVLTEPGAVTVTALRAFPECRGARIHRVEIPYGRFERRIQTPLGAELSDRMLADGVLTLVFTKRPEPGKETE
jgi:HSP20 family molecular chaperone IbpA